MVLFNKKIYSEVDTQELYKLDKKYKTDVETKMKHFLR